MDKKTLIGFALFIVVLLVWFPLWNALFPPKPGPVTSPDTTTAVQSPTDTARETPADTSLLEIPPAVTIAAADSEALAIGQNEPERLITVDTKNLRVVLSSVGGNVKEVMLKNYLASDAEPVQLIGDEPAPEWARYGALTLGSGDKIAPFNTYSFQVEGEDIILNRQDSTTTITFTYDSPDGASIAKKYTFHYTDYLFDLDISIDQPSKLEMGRGITLGWFTPLESTEEDIGQDKGKLGGFFYMGGEFDYFNKLKNGGLKQSASGPIEWMASRTKYFTAIISSVEQPANEVTVIGRKAAKPGSNGKSVDWAQYGIGMTYNNPDQKTKLSFNVYTGPLDYDRLKKLGGGYTSLIDFGWRLFRPFAVAILWFFTNLHKVIANYGLVIIVFSIIMKAIFWPLSLKSGKSMYKMKEIQPKLQELREKFKNDPAKLNAETMKAYKEFGVNPFGSCLPMLIQLPIFWALYSVLSNTIELRGADFVFWITDLSRPDPSGKLTPLGIGVLPVIMGVAMFFQQKMTITDPKQKMMIYLMPALFTFLFSRWASGLVLYWTMFSLIGIVEQWMILRHIDAEKASKQKL